MKTTTIPNPLKLYLDNIKNKHYDEVRALVMATCHWDRTKWNNKLQGRSSLTELEMKEIKEIEKMIRVREELNWSISEYLNKTQPGVLLSEHELSVLDKHSKITYTELFGAGAEIAA